jgi:hypothetical protein
MENPELIKHVSKMFVQCGGHCSRHTLPEKYCFIQVGERKDVYQKVLVERVNDNFF